MDPYRPRFPARLLTALALCHVDWKPAQRPPSMWRVIVATLVSIAASLGADALLVAVGTRIFPSTTGYTHFRFGDYGRLTVIGVVIACAAWPVVVRITSTPRWLFFRMAILVTVVLWVPDIYLLARHQPAEAVAILMCMHVAIALVTYSALVHLAPAQVGAHLPAERGRPAAVGAAAGAIEAAPAEQIPDQEDAGRAECKEEDSVRS